MTSTSSTVGFNADFSTFTFTVVLLFQRDHWSNHYIQHVYILLKSVSETFSIVISDLEQVFTTRLSEIVPVYAITLQHMIKYILHSFMWY